MEWFDLAKGLLSFFLAAILSFYLTPVIRQAAIRFGIVDKPDGKLKLQAEPVAYLGGLAVFISLLATVSIAYEFDHTAVGILLGASLIIVLGLIDDFGVLSPKIKLGGQLAAVWMLYKSGVHIQIAALPDWVNIILTFIWIVGVTNAFNLIDVMDGLATGTGFIAAGFLATISFINGNDLIAAFTIILAGSLLGFLPHNFRPAKIYLGDTGSMAIGFILAALTINEQYTVHNDWLALLAPVIIIGIPIFETGFLIVVRISKGLHPLRGSPDHFSLRMRRMGWSVERSVLTTYFVGVILGGIGMTVVYAERDTAIAAIVFAGLFFVTAIFFLLSEEIVAKYRSIRANGRN
jgi:UDP-GlcNAc:undecaprenyl-phosphate GlcNAc-1-phosphate transferase